MTPSRFDLVLLGAAVAMTLALAAVLLLGDRVGVQLRRVGPVGEARSTSSVTVQFSEPMSRASVEPRLTFDPPLDGTFDWTGTTMRFTPAQALEPGRTYQATLDAGALAEGGRRVLNTHTFAFTVARPRVAFLGPASSGPHNVFLADPATPDAPPTQLTFSDTGIFNFAVSPDGSQIAYAEVNRLTRQSDIVLLDLATGTTRPLTRCDLADCISPAWSPDGRTVAFERADTGSLNSLGVSPTRIWVIDALDPNAQARPLFDDSQTLGYGAQWSADGGRIALFDSNTGGILVYDFALADGLLVSSRNGTVGTLSPDGTQLVFPEIILDGQQTRSRLRLADLTNLTTPDFRPLTDPGAPIEEMMAVWHPDGTRLAVAYRDMGGQGTRGAQVYIVDAATGEATPLVFDARYANGFFTWDPTGHSLVIQRFPELAADGAPNYDGKPEVWTVNADTAELTRVAVDGFHPRWVP